MGQNLIFSRTGFDQSANQGLGEWKAYFAKDESLARAFSSAASKEGLATRGGVVAYNIAQINERIEQLEGKDGAEGTLEQLKRGRTVLETKTTRPAQQPAQLRA
jgi:hypothetical protein